MTMEKFKTHAGPKSFDDIVSEVMGKPKAAENRVFAAQAVLPGERPKDSEMLGPNEYEVKDAKEISYMKREIAGFFEADDDHVYASISAATGPVGPAGPYPVGPPGANGPAGPLHPSTPTAPSSSGHLPLRDRAEVDLRKAIRRCLEEHVPMDRMVEIFRLELVEVVHDD